MLQSLISSKTRIRLLVKFFINAANDGYLRGLAVELDENTNAIRKELNNLSAAGYIIRQDVDNKVVYQADTTHPLFATLQQLVLKYVGIDRIIIQVLDRMGQVTRIFLVGDYAKGIDSGKIQIVIEGPELYTDYLNQLADRLHKEIDKEIDIASTPLFMGQGLLIFENIG
jgi:hypothetical protein